MLNWDLKNFDTKMDCKNISTKKRHMPYIIQIHYLEFAIFASIVNLHRGVEWVGSFLTNFQKGEEENILFRLDDSYVVFVAAELHPDTIFFQHFFA